MKRILAIFGLVCLGLSLLADLLLAEDPATQGPPGSRIAFHDEFEGPTLNEQIWALGINDRNVQNKNVECVYMLKNIAFRDGVLVLTQRIEDPPVLGRTWTSEEQFSYSSGGIHTRKEYMLQTNMYVELRCRLPTNNAGYGAFWTVSRKFGDWKPEDLLEIDMFEYIGNPSKRKFWSGLWWHDFRKDEVPDVVPPSSIKKRSDDHFFIDNQLFKAHFGEGIKTDFSKIDFEAFVTFGLKVTEGSMEWYLVQDGPAWKSKPYMSFSGGKVKNRTYGRAPDLYWERGVPRELNSQINLNYALRNAEWAGGPAEKVQLPAEMLVDYVRVYHVGEVSQR